MQVDIKCNFLSDQEVRIYVKIKYITSFNKTKKIKYFILGSKFTKKN